MHPRVRDLRRWSTHPDYMHLWISNPRVPQEQGVVILIHTEYTNVPEPYRGMPQITWRLISPSEPYTDLWSDLRMFHLPGTNLYAPKGGTMMAYAHECDWIVHLHSMRKLIRGWNDLHRM